MQFCTKARVATDTDISIIQNSMHYLTSFSHSQLWHRLTQGYKWHEFLSIIPPPLPSHLFLPCAVEIKDCWAKGNSDSINLHLSLRVTFPDKVAQHSVKCGSILPKPWLVPLKYGFFLYIKWAVLVSRQVQVHNTNLQDHGICHMTSVTHLSLSIFSFFLFREGLLSMQAHSAATCLTFMPLHTFP